MLGVEAPRLSGATIEVDSQRLTAPIRASHHQGARKAPFDEDSIARLLEKCVGFVAILGDGTSIQFYMHDSFKPSRFERTFSGGSAEVAVSAWGGFTVGIWIPSKGVELELDLATQASAPNVIRTH